MTLYGFYRAGEADVAALARREGEEQQNAKIYAETESANYSKPLPSFFECVQNGKFTATDIVLPDSLFPNSGRVYNCVINDRKGARTAMNQGYYEMESYFHVKEGETVRLGVQKPTRSSTTGYSSTISTCITLAMERQTDPKV